MPTQIGGSVSSIRSADGAISLDDFYAMPWTTKCHIHADPNAVAGRQHQHDFAGDPDGQGTKPKLVRQTADWLAKFRRVEQMSWVPGEPEVIEGRLIYESGWKDRPGARCLNLYLPPTIVLGDPAKASQWIDHVRLVYPNDAEHIQDWLAQRAQDPGTKPNHAIAAWRPARHWQGHDSRAGARGDRPWNFQDITPDALDRAVQPAREGRDLAHQRSARPRRQHALQPLCVLREDKDIGRGPAGSAVLPATNTYPSSMSPTWSGSSSPPTTRPTASF